MSDEKRICPDGGVCHHQCYAGCYRTVCCGPLSGVYPNDEWPKWLVAWTQREWLGIVPVEESP